jgi:hypothetical protein
VGPTKPIERASSRIVGVMTEIQAEYRPNTSYGIGPTAPLIGGTGSVYIFRQGIIKSEWSIKKPVSMNGSKYSQKFSYNILFSNTFILIPQRNSSFTASVGSLLVSF